MRCCILPIANVSLVIDDAGRAPFSTFEGVPRNACTGPVYRAERRASDT